MKRLWTIISLVTVLTSCATTTKKTNYMEDKTKQTDKSTLPVDTTPKVTGIGGIFFNSDHLKETKEWYSKNLGIKINDWGSSSFESRNINKPDEINSLQWKPFKKGDEYFSPSKKDFMINYTVQHIEELVKKLKENGVTILDSIATYDFGKFVHIMDAEGNKIELWEPVESKDNHK
jgi:predicted enzyme related to lactoylglutathione lyase